MNKCHEGCLGSRDCPEGESCVMVAGVGVCQGPAETACAKDRPCAGSLSCASDLRCRATCTGAGNCAEKQVCIDGVCADPGDLVGGKLPQPPQSNPLTPGKQDAGTGPTAPDGGRWPDAATTLYGLTPGTSCFKITSVAPGTTDRCDLGVDSLVGQDLPGNYDPTTGTFKLGSAASLGQGIVSSNSAILSRSTTQGYLSIADCTWDQVATTTLTMTGENKFTVSVVEDQSRFTRACPAPLATCRSTWTWTMELDSSVSASYCQAESVTPPPVVVLTANPPSIDLGVVDVGQKSSPVTITVTNTGTTTSAPLNVFASGTGITASGCSGTKLAPRDSCTLRVTASPPVVGTISGTIEVGDGAASTGKIAVSGIAVTTGMFTLAPSPLDLGTVLQGQKVSGTIVLTNKSLASMTGIAITVSGTGFSSVGGTCTDTLASGAACDIGIGFTSGLTTGVAKGSVTVSQGGVTKTVPVLATVQAPAKLVMAPSSATLQTVLGTPSAPVTFYVTNAGDVSSAIPTVSITGTHKDDFAFTSTCAVPLPGGATSSCQVVVVYNPKSVPATQSGATLVVSEPGGASATATLTGVTFSGGPGSIIQAKTSDLGTVVVGQTGTAVTLTVTNSGAGTAEALALTTSPAQFVLTDDQCTGKDLAPKSSCTALVRFTPAPDQSGVVQGQVKLTAANVAYPQLFGITGTAVPPAKLKIDPPTLDFHTVPAMQESTPLTLTIANIGGAPSGNLKVEKTGAEFVLKADSCSGVPLAVSRPTNTCSIVVTFTPTSATSDATGSVVVTDISGAAGSVSAPLHGAGRTAVP